MSINKSILNKSHDKKSFDCGNQLLNNYLQKVASQDIKRRLAVCTIFSEGSKIIGYYTLSNNSLPSDLVPEKYSKKIKGAYKHVPVTLLGRLAIDNTEKGKGYGESLLIDALKSAYEVSEMIGSMAVIVDPIDENAQRFYEKYGFILIPDSGKMFLPMLTISKLF